MNLATKAIMNNVMMKLEWQAERIDEMGMREKSAQDKMKYIHVSGTIRAAIADLKEAIAYQEKMEATTDSEKRLP